MSIKPSAQKVSSIFFALSIMLVCISERKSEYDFTLSNITATIFSFDFIAYGFSINSIFLNENEAFSASDMMKFEKQCSIFV